MAFERSDGAVSGVAAVNAGESKLVINLIHVQVCNKRRGHFVVKEMEGGAKTSRHKQFVNSLLHEEYLIPRTRQHCFDMNAIRVKAIQDEHVRITGGRAIREYADLVCKDLASCLYALNVDHVRASTWGVRLIIGGRQVIDGVIVIGIGVVVGGVVVGVGGIVG